MQAARLRGRTGLREIIEQQAFTNRSNLRWAEAYRGHRERLTALLIGQAGEPETRRICLLGAGNCCDVDLPLLCAAYREVHLVDLDAAAVARAISALDPDQRDKVFAHAPVDLTGFLGRADRWRRTPPTLRQVLDHVPVAVEGILAKLPAPFEVVASCCVVTQLFRGVAQVLGQDHPGLWELQRAAAAVHWRTMAEATAPEGRVVFVTDLVSNDTYPLEHLGPDQDLNALREELLRDWNCFRGGDLVWHARLLRTDERLRSAFDRPDVISPWLWHASDEQVFLVAAWTLERRGGEPRLCGGGRRS